jgi:sulfur carrier protein
MQLVGNGGAGNPPSRNDKRTTWTEQNPRGGTGSHNGHSAPRAIESTVPQCVSPRLELPMKIVINGQDREVATATTVANLIDELGIEKRHVAVEVNLELIPRAKHAAHQLQDGDQLEVVTLVGGG